MNINDIFNKINELNNSKKVLIQERTDLWIMNEDYSHEISALEENIKERLLKKEGMDSRTYVLPAVYNFILFGGAALMDGNFSLPLLLSLSIIPTASYLLYKRKEFNEFQRNENDNTIQSINNQIEEDKKEIIENKKKIRVLDREINAIKNEISRLNDLKYLLFNESKESSLNIALVNRR